MKPVVIGVVIARGGSKGVPGKNLARVGGHPLVGWAILSARKARTLDRIILSTDSPKIAWVGQRYGAEVPFSRPASLARDGTHTPPVLEHAVSFLEGQGQKVDVVVTLQASSPFRRPEHIDATVRRLLNSPRLDSVITVKEVSFPPFWMLRDRGGILKPFVEDGVDYSLKERQQMSCVYQPNGAVYATRRDLLKKRGLIFSAFAGGKTGCVVMDSVSSLDVDHPMDLEVVRTAFKMNPHLLERM